MYFVRSGSLDVTIAEVNDGKSVRRYRAGEFFGELALSKSGAARRATITAHERCVLLSLPRTAYLQVITADEAALKMLQEQVLENEQFEDEQFEDEATLNAAEDELEAAVEMCFQGGIPQEVIDSVLWEWRMEPIIHQAAELRHLVEVRAVHHHYREWAIVCSYLEALGADHDLSEPEVVVSELMERLRTIGLEVEGHPTASKTAWIIQISANEKALLFWATRMGLPMRLKGDETKNRDHPEFGGMVPFKETKKEDSKRLKRKSSSPIVRFHV